MCLLLDFQRICNRFLGIFLYFIYSKFHFEAPYFFCLLYKDAYLASFDEVKKVYIVINTLHEFAKILSFYFSFFSPFLPLLALLYSILLSYYSCHQSVM